VILAGALVALALVAGDRAASESMAEAERQYGRRGEGARGAVADTSRIDAAIDAYGAARAADPDSIPAQVGLMRALFFRGGFTGEQGAEQKASFAAAKAVADDAMRRLERRLKAAPKRSRREALATIPDVAALHFWAGVSLGQWCLDHKLAAAWQGAAGKIRDWAEVAVAVDAGYEQGSPYLLLGRLHTDSPKVPFVTGFISRSKGVESLRRALAISPHNTATQFFLAQALLEHEPKSREQAVGLLKACAAQEPRREFLVEDAHYRELSRARLSGLDPRP
jgi:hypothetical protein